MSEPATSQNTIVKEVITVAMGNGKKDPDTGSCLPIFNDNLRQQVFNSTWLGNKTGQEKNERLISGVMAMTGIKPQDEMEGMLAAQMVALHNASMECFRRAMIADQSFEGRQQSLTQGNKLSRSYAALMESLDRHRGKRTTEQKVTVEHVNVHSGGQAIVGNVNSPGGGVKTKNHTQPHVPETERGTDGLQLEDGTDEGQCFTALRCEDAQGKPVPSPCNG